MYVRVCYYQFIPFTVQVYIYELSDATLTQKTELEHLGPVTDASYSPDNKYLVACDANRKVILYAVPEYKVKYLTQNNLELYSVYKLLRL